MSIYMRPRVTPAPVPETIATDDGPPRSPRCLGLEDAARALFRAARRLRGGDAQRLRALARRIAEITIHLEART